MAHVLILPEEAHEDPDGVHSGVGDNRTLFWVRVAGAALCLISGGTTEVGNWFGLNRPPVYAVVLSLILDVLFAALFWILTRDFPAARPWHAKLLALQVLLSIPLSSDFGIVNALAIPLVRPAPGRSRWLIAQIVAQVLSLGFLLITQGLLQLQPNQFTEAAWAIGAGTVQQCGWVVLAYIASTLIVRIDEDRRRLTALNAELLSSRALLSESTRLSERLRIARELHDSLGHHLTTLNLNLEIALHVDAPAKNEQIRKAQFLAKLLLADLRDSVSAWRNEKSVALPEALRALAAGATGLGVTVSIEPDLPPVEPEVAHALLRCAQESLTNVLRHASATHVAISLKMEGARMILSIDDTGRGCDKIVPGGGLSGILSRAKELGGDAVYSSTPGGGFSVQVTLPWPGERK